MFLANAFKPIRRPLRNSVGHDLTASTNATYRNRRAKSLCNEINECIQYLHQNKPKKRTIDDDAMNVKPPLVILPTSAGEVVIYQYRLCPWFSSYPRLLNG